MSKMRYKQFQKATKFLEPWVIFPTKGRLYDKRRRQRDFRKARKAGMSLEEYSSARLFGYV